MLPQFERVYEFEHLLMDEVGAVVKIIPRQDASPVLLIQLEDGSQVQASSSKVVNWRIDVSTGLRELTQAKADRRIPLLGSPVTFTWNKSKTAPERVLVWKPRLFDCSWPVIRLAKRRTRGQGVDVYLWEGRDDSRMRKEVPYEERVRGTMEVNWCGKWLPYKQVFA